MALCVLLNSGWCFALALSPMLLWTVLTLANGGLGGLSADLTAGSGRAYAHNGLLLSAFASIILPMLGMFVIGVWRLAKRGYRRDPTTVCHCTVGVADQKSICVLSPNVSAE